MPFVRLPVSSAFNTGSSVNYRSSSWHGAATAWLYQAGKMAGVALGRFANRAWKGRFDRVVLLETAWTDTNVQARVAGVLVGLRELLGEIEESRSFTWMAGHIWNRARPRWRNR